MSGVRSLRSRLLLGALFWTIGLFVGAVLIMTLIIMRYAVFPRIMHGTAYTHATLFSTITIICMVVGFVHFRKGISPMQALRSRLGGVREGRERRVEGRYPSEVQPLVDDLNALLDHRERTIARAIAKAGDLAHGLKTPLAVLAQEAERAESAGQLDVADAIRQQVDRMRRQIDYHLAQARAAASGAAPGASCAVIASSEALARTLRRLYADRPLAIDQNVPPEHAVRCQREDLDEMLGNLLDNACKWSRSRVSIESAQVDGRIVVTVDDDGPGIPAAMREAVLQRGVRADEAAPGTGLGLAIVRDLAELYGGSIALADSPLGGLRASLKLPVR
ncbi:MAG TPA: sensor histidine kinase [Vicinamibacterales bacterium]|jgi:signal transduction histidine kinase|nr:sensor histidine kinase [Vicinamibacterales bacterium]